MKSLSLPSAAGLALALAGQAMRTAAMVTAGRNFTHRIAAHRRPAHRLVTWGPYACVRTALQSVPRSFQRRRAARGPPPSPHGALTLTHAPSHSAAFSATLPTPAGSTGALPRSCCWQTPSARLPTHSPRGPSSDTAFRASTNSALSTAGVDVTPSPTPCSYEEEQLCRFFGREYVRYAKRTYVAIPFLRAPAAGMALEESHDEDGGSDR